MSTTCMNTNVHKTVAEKPAHDHKDVPLFKPMTDGHPSKFSPRISPRFQTLVHFTYRRWIRPAMIYEARQTSLIALD